MFQCRPYWKYPLACSFFIPYYTFDNKTRIHTNKTKNYFPEEKKIHLFYQGIFCGHVRRNERDKLQSISLKRKHQNDNHCYAVFFFLFFFLVVEKNMFYSIYLVRVKGVRENHQWNMLSIFETIPLSYLSNL